MADLNDNDLPGMWSHSDLSGGATDAAPLLGEMAHVLRDWRALGVTKASLEYVVEQVWPAD